MAPFGGFRLEKVVFFHIIIIPSPQVMGKEKTFPIALYTKKVSQKDGNRTIVKAPPQFGHLWAVWNVQCWGRVLEFA